MFAPPSALYCGCGRREAGVDFGRAGGGRILRISAAVMGLKGSAVGTAEALEKTELARCSGLARLREGISVPSTSEMGSRGRVDGTCGAGMPWTEWRRGILLVNPCEKEEVGTTYLSSSLSSGKGGGGFLVEEEREMVTGSSLFSSGEGPPKRLS
jgi:hypothetical protein